MRAPRDKHAPPRWWRHLPAALVTATLVTAIGLALYPLLERAQARREAQALTRAVAEAPTPIAPRATDVKTDRCAAPDLPGSPLRLSQRELAGWQSVGGCGVGGAGQGGGGVKWVGRGVSGGLLDLQCITSHSAFFDGAQQTTVNTRFAHTLEYKWVLAATIPFKNNIEDVDVYGESETAHLPGWGDVSLELTRKLGVTNAYTLTLSTTLPTGSADAVRQGVVLPQRMQLGAGVLTGSVTLEHTRDFDWGLMIFGSSLSYGGLANRMGDQRASSLSVYAHAGYILGPFVMSTGLSLSHKFGEDLERGEPIPDQPMSTASLNLTAEWSSDWVAALLSSSSDLQALTGAFGLQTSLF